jgi:alanine-alpha-ketoisovalerate/valine-pyruvate aminotransferase
MIQQVDVYFKNYSKDMIKESNTADTVGRYTGSQSKVRTEKLIQFESSVETMLASR